MSEETEALQKVKYSIVYRTETQARTGAEAMGLLHQAMDAGLSPKPAAPICERYRLVKCPLLS